MSFKLRFALYVVLMLFILTVPAYAQQTKSFSDSHTIGNNGEVSVDTYKGSIEVVAWNGDTVEIDAVIEGDRNDELVKYTEVRVRKSGRSVYVETDYSEAKKIMKRWNKKNLSLPYVHYTIRMPRSAELSIDDYKSDIDVEGLRADLALETYKGTVDLQDIEGELNIETYKGDVRIRELAGGLSADTYKGSFDVEFTELTEDTIFDTYRGDIEVTLPRDAGFDLDADLGNKGDFDASFRTADLKRSKKHYRGEVQGGGPRLEFETYRGSFMSELPDNEAYSFVSG